MISSRFAKFASRTSAITPLLRFSSSTTTSTTIPRKVRLSLCQMKVSAVKSENLDRVQDILSSAASENPQIVVLPEIWNSPYATTQFPLNAEAIPNIGEQPTPEANPSTSILCEQAKKHKFWLIGGSIPERMSVNGKDQIYNTSIIINPEGQIVGKHRKVHLFDIDIPGKMTFRESDSLTPGDQITIVDTPWGKVGVGICYDMRFAELALAMRKQGCVLLVYPGAFNMVTGPVHWQLLQRARALDNQLYVAACSPARDESSSYIAYGHSSIVSPWGEVLKDAGPQPGIVTAEIDLDFVETVRQNIPISKQKRSDLYSLDVK